MLLLVHQGPGAGLEGRSPRRGGRGMTDGLSCLGLPPGLLSWTMRLGDPRGWLLCGGEGRYRDKTGSVWELEQVAVPALPLASWLTLGRKLGPPASVSSSVQKESINHKLFAACRALGE